MVYTIVVHLQSKPDAVEKIKAKLIEAAGVYRKDKETLDWHVMQDPKDETKFCIVERYEQESSQQYHLNNPYWKTFDPYVIPLLAKPMDLTRWEEISYVASFVLFALNHINHVQHAQSLSAPWKPSCPSPSSLSTHHSTRSAPPEALPVTRHLPRGIPLTRCRHKLKVTELKELLAKNSLVQTGKKDELIKRLMDNNVTIDGEGEGESNEDLIEPPSEETPKTAAAVAPAQPSAPVVDSSSATTAAASSVTAPAETESTAAPALTPDQLAMKARAERFGVPFNPNPTPRTAAKPAATDSKPATSTAAAAAPAPSAKGEKKGAIDSAPLGVSEELLAKRAAKFGLPEKKAPVTAEGVVAVKPEEKKKPEPEITPEIAARIAEDEEKKRKRAEKFGTGAPATANGSSEPDAKKAKV
ncbi:hypothetical protein EHS25_009159 [Saitozyma podzolica]|uniref:SAP domain-containing protein n=1 Tax=Saitozyma podzolica TaxID=1890683 RepID=A0A427YL50_9TREE|nr:hypothetical protein EHS25_009159 [Saitozyma podzolica]